MDAKIYQSPEEFKDLTERILQEKKSLGIGAIVLTSMIDKKYFSPEFQDKRKNLTKDLPNVQVSARINKEKIRIGFYLFDKEIPIIFEYSGQEAKNLYDLLSK